ncbi:MAG: tRNA (guanosine(37)-N1)-methyltransferase TrmD [Eubacteriaceae bacterium]
MKFYVLTLFPEMFENFLNTSIIKKGIEKNLITVEFLNIRDFSKNKHKKTDDYPYGGGAGMVMTPQPLSDAIIHAKEKSKEAKVIYFSPHGKVLTQKSVINYSKENEIILLCGHYEGIDNRIIEKYVDYEISLGDYILTGGELAGMVFIDSVSRNLEGVLGNTESTTDESFSEDLLEYPQYTRPQNFEGMKVPDVLISGNHEMIRKWRYEKSIEVTKNKRPDMYKKYRNEG